MTLDPNKKKSFLMRLRQIAAGLLLGYVVFVGLLFMLQRDLQYLPDRSLMPLPQETLVPEMQPVFITAKDGADNQSWLYLPAGVSPKVIVFFHGNASNLAGRAEKVRPLIDAGYGVLLVGYRGYENNVGAPSQQGLFADARAAVDYLHADRHIPLSDMIFYGESLGSGVATQMASEYPGIAALVLEVPFDSALAVAQARYPFVVGLSYLMKDPYRSDVLIPHLTMPKLIVAAQQDEIIPHRHAQHLFDLAAGPKTMVMIEGAMHNSIYQHGGGKKIVSFLHSVVPVKNGGRLRGATGAFQEVPVRPGMVPLVLYPRGIVPLVMNVEIAQTADELARGLMDRPALPQGQGMLFLFHRTQVVGFWMKNTLIPLDMLFLDEHGKIVKVHAGAQPGDKTVISSDLPVRAVLEVAGGTVQEKGLAVGDRVDISSVPSQLSAN